MFAGINGFQIQGVAILPVRRPIPLRIHPEPGYYQYPTPSKCNLRYSITSFLLQVLLQLSTKTYSLYMWQVGVVDPRWEDTRDRQGGDTLGQAEVTSSRGCELRAWHSGWWGNTAQHVVVFKRGFQKITPDLQAPLVISAETELSCSASVSLRWQQLG
jgi:hypothetical protein